jgi:SAM-dependent methyltransferase
MNLSKRTLLELFALSVVSLFFELLAIRWLSADFRAFAVFRTFPLVTCFVGLGAGFALNRDAVFRYTPWALVFFVGVAKLAEFFKVGFWGFPSASVFNWQSLPVEGMPGAVYLVMFSFVLLLLLAGPFLVSACIGARLGVLFNQAASLQSYAVNLAGALLGSCLFTLLSFLGSPPWQLLLVTAGALALFAPGRKRLVWLAAACLVAVLAALPCPVSSMALSEAFTVYQEKAAKTFWSPYQRLDLRLYRDKAESGQETGRFLGLELGVNRLFYQYFFSPELALSSFPADLRGFVQIRRDQYSLPEKIKPSPEWGPTVTFDRGDQSSLPAEVKPGRSVLVLAAGTGQDVAAAVQHGATEVDAVDIDPVILELGRRYNPIYSQPSVHLFCDDARHYIGRCKKKYDLIVYSFLDSHAVLGQGSSVRLDSYPYTQEGIVSGLNLLQPDGLMVVSFSAVTPWLERRLYKTISEAVGYEPLLIEGKEGFGHLFFVLGQAVRDRAVQPPAGWKLKDKPQIDPGERSLTDDWPYLYVRPDVLDVPYLLIIFQIVLASFLAARRVLVGKGNLLHWQMFFLGAAFLLLELHSISFLSLLYGSTWLTSAVAINGILLMIFCSNLLVMKFGRFFVGKEWLIYLLLLLSIAGDYLLPVTALAGEPEVLRYSLLTLVTLLPLCVAGFLFSALFSRVDNAAQALAFNLFGSVVGGMLEYLSNFWGVKALCLVAAWFYLMALLCLLKGGRADRTA